MKATVEILGVEMDVDYEFEITHSGAPESWSSYGGDPAEPAEFDITIHGLDFHNRHADVPKPEMPDWLRDILATHLAERNDINDIVQKADMERDYSDEEGY